MIASIEAEGGLLFVGFKLAKKHIIIISIIVVVIVAAILTLVIINNQSGDSTSNNNNDTPQTETGDKPLDFIPAGEERQITIPGYTGIYLQHGTKSQTVDLYNPESNNCYFVISIYLSNDTRIFQSDYIRPGEHITDIEITQELQKGIYKNCRLVYECFSLDTKTQLNGSSQNIEINSK